MKKLILSLFLVISTMVFSQQPFRYDTIRVSKDDTRNIHQGQLRTQMQDQQRKRISTPSSSSVKKVFDAKNMRYGLNLGLSFSNYYSLFRLAPQVGYQFNKYVMAGVGMSYYHSKYKSYISNTRITDNTNSLGGNVFGYLYPTSFLAISIQPEANYIWTSSKDAQGTYNKRDVLVPSAVIGAGLRLGRAHAMLYYDLIQDVNSPYTSGVFYGVSVYF